MPTRIEWMRLIGKEGMRRGRRSEENINKDIQMPTRIEWTEEGKEGDEKKRRRVLEGREEEEMDEERKRRTEDRGV